MLTLKSNEAFCRNCGAKVSLEEAVSLAVGGRQVLYCDQECVNDALSQARPQTIHRIHDKPIPRGGLV